MSNLTVRIQKRIKSTFEHFRRDRQFSLRYAALRMASDLCGRAGFRNVSDWAYEKKERWLISYLEKRLSPVIARYQDNADEGTTADDAPIWICWWTGEDSAPPLVQQCIRSIRHNAGPHPVHLITEATYSQYLHIPEFMLEKAAQKQIGLAHLADYIRVQLLAAYGGLWLDATIFCSQPLPDWYFTLPVFTCRSETRICRYVSAYRWVTFCLGGKPGNVFYRFLADAFEEYWKHENAAIDYLFFDYIIDIAYRNIPAVKQQLDAIPLNNLHRDDLQAAMNAALPASEFPNVIHPDTALYKLSWRESYSDFTPNRQKSIYAYFLDLPIGQ